MDCLIWYAIVAAVCGTIAALMGDDLVSSIALFFIVGALWIVFVPGFALCWSVQRFADCHNRRVLDRWLKSRGLS